MTKKKPSAQLKKAKKLIEKGWCKGSMRSRYEGKERYCAVGAIDFVTFNDTDMTRKCEVYLKSFLPRPFARIDGFNDAPSTKKEDVLALYDAAIHKAQVDEKAHAKKKA